MKCWNVYFKEISTGKKWSIYFRSSTFAYEDAVKIVSQKFPNYKVHSIFHLTHKKFNHFSQILPTVKLSEFYSHRSCMIEEILSPE